MYLKSFMSKYPLFFRIPFTLGRHRVSLPKQHGTTPSDSCWSKQWGIRLWEQIWRASVDWVCPFVWDDNGKWRAQGVDQTNHVQWRNWNDGGDSCEKISTRERCSTLIFLDHLKTIICLYSACHCYSCAGISYLGCNLNITPSLLPRSHHWGTGPCACHGDNNRLEWYLQYSISSHYTQQAWNYPTRLEIVTRKPPMQLKFVFSNNLFTSLFPTLLKMYFSHEKCWLGTAYIIWCFQNDSYWLSLSVGAKEETMGEQAVKIGAPNQSEGKYELAVEEQPIRNVEPSSPYWVSYNFQLIH